MPVTITKPTVVIQNRLTQLLSSHSERVAYYRQVLDRRIGELERAREATLLVPGASGMRLRLPGKPFHATPEIFFQERGRTRFSLPDESITIRGGQALLVPAGMPHGEAWSGRDFLNVIVMFPENGFSLHFGYLEKGLRCGPVDCFPTSQRHTLLHGAAELAERRETRSGHLIRYAVYLALLVRLREALDTDARPDEEKPSLVRRALESIDTHFGRMDFSVKWLARELGCSPDHLSRCFRRQFGQRLIAFIHRKRTDYACRLLRESDMNIAETAWACGFSHPSYFNRIFRAYIGVSPRKFRENVSGYPRS
jgi:AraC-like DNA-binding protein